MSSHLKKITSGGSSVIASGTVISFDAEPVTFEFGSQDVSLKLTLDFRTDGSSNFRLAADQVADNELKLTVYNTKDDNAMLGAGPLQPIPIGSLNSKNVFFSFRVYTLQQSTQKTVHYTIYEKS